MTLRNPLLAVNYPGRHRERGDTCGAYHRIDFLVQEQIQDFGKENAPFVFPIAVTFIVGFIAPSSVALVGFLMFGNLIRECGVLGSLSETAQNTLTNLITLLLGITISFSMKADAFIRIDTLFICGCAALSWWLPV